MNRFGALLCFLPLCFCITVRATEYHGSVGQHEASFVLKWQNDGRVTGSYFFSSQKGQIRTIVGSNYEEGKLYLEEHAGQSLIAKCYLQKSLTGGNVVWEGEMQTADGRYPVRFSRQRVSKPPSVSPAPTKELSDEDFAKRIPSEVTWSNFPKAAQTAAVPYSFHSARTMRAKVETCQSGTDYLTLGLRIGLSENGDWSKTRFNGPLVTFRINRALPIPSEELIGDEISLDLDAAGNLLAMNLLGIGVTHVRKSRDSEKREVKVLVENDDFAALFDETVSEENRRKAIERIPSFSFLPDKIALLNEDSDMLMFFRVLQLTRDFGVVVQTMDTGPGILELESLTLDAPSDPNPWIAVGEWSKWGPLPGAQRAEG